jgi:hypothetical protein
MFFGKEINLNSSFVAGKKKIKIKIKIGVDLSVMIFISVV